MKAHVSLLAVFALTAGLANSAVIISQYAEDGNIKGIELWNTGAAAVDLSSTSLVIGLYANGSATATSTYTVSAGTIAANGVLVLADGSANTIWDDSGITYVETNFSFNGNDALTVSVGGTLEDTFGTVGSDPGTNWSGGGVDTETANIELAVGITTGDTDGWSDPSERFVNVEQGLLDDGSGGDLAGFGLAPIPETTTALLGALGLLGILRRRR